MSKAVKLNMDMTYEVVDLPDDDGGKRLRELIGHYYDIAFVNGPFGIHPDQVVVGVAVDDEGLMKHKQLEMNRFATAFGGVFRLQAQPLVGPAVIVANDYNGDPVDVPDWVIELLDTIEVCVREAFKVHHYPGMN